MKIGVVLRLDEDRRSGRVPRYKDVRDRALQAEAAGFDSVWVYDHLLHRFPGTPTVGFWECWTMLSAVAEATWRVEVGTLVSCIAFRNPALLAKMAATLDEISDGRLILGLGAGWHAPEFEAFGIPYDHRVARFEEALRIATPLLRDGHVDFAGTFHRAPSCELRPRGPRPDGPPVVIAAFGPRMLRLAAQFADGWNTDWLGAPDLPARRAAIEAACAEVGRDPATLEITGGLTLAYPELGDLPTWMTTANQYLTGGAAEVGAALRAYEEAGVGHAMCTVYPDTPAALARLAAALPHYRGQP